MFTRKQLGGFLKATSKLVIIVAFVYFTVFIFIVGLIPNLAVSLHAQELKSFTLRAAVPSNFDLSDLNGEKREWEMVAQVKESEKRKKRLDAGGTSSDPQTVVPKIINSPKEIVKTYIEGFKTKNYQLVNSLREDYQLKMWDLKQENHPDFIYKKKKAELDHKFFLEYDHWYKIGIYLLKGKQRDWLLTLEHEYELSLYLTLPEFRYSILDVRKKTGEYSLHYHGVYVQIEYPDKQSAPFTFEKWGGVGGEKG